MRCIYTKVANSYSKKIRQKNLTPRIPPFKVTDGVPLAVGYRRLGSEKNTMMGLPGEEKFNDSRLEYTIHEWDGQKPADSNYQAYA